MRRLGNPIRTLLNGQRQLRALARFYSWRGNALPPEDATHVVLQIPGHLEPASTMRELHRFLEQEGFNVCTFHVAWKSLATFGYVRAHAMAWVAHILEERPNIERITFVTHSKGGLVATDLIESGLLNGKTVELITLGTMHRGTWASVLGFFWTQSAYQLHPWHPRFWKKSVSRMHEVRILTVAGSEDWMVSARSALRDDAEQEILDVGHVELLADKQVWQRMLRFLRSTIHRSPMRDT